MALSKKKKSPGARPAGNSGALVLPRRASGSRSGQNPSIEKKPKAVGSELARASGAPAASKRTRASSLPTVATAAELRAAKADTPARYADFQKFMFRAYTRPVTKDDRADPEWDDGRPAKELFAAFVKGDGFRNPLERVQTYNRMYWYRTLDSLWEDFPGVRAIVGKKFTTLAEAYLEKHPSTSFTLRHLGHAFPAWLKRNSAKLPAGVAGAAAECAAVEWALCVAFEAAAEPTLDPAKLGPAEKLKIGLQPHLALFALKHDIPEFLRKLRLADNEHAEAGNAAATAGPTGTKTRSRAVRPAARKTFAAVYRAPDDAITTKRLEAAEYALLADLAAGAPLGLALGRAGRRRGAPDATKLQGWFADWMSRGWLTGKNATRGIRVAGSRAGVRVS